MTKPFRILWTGVCALLLLIPPGGQAGEPSCVPASLIDRARFEQRVADFASWDREEVVNLIPNREAWAWMQQNVPLFECPDQQIEEIYAFRWWTFRKHIKQTADGVVITEFLAPVRWAGKHNTISCAAGHHIYEGRWIRNQSYIQDYLRFWFRGGGDPRKYSFWAADSAWAFYLATGNATFTKDLFRDLSANHDEWKTAHGDTEKKPRQVPQFGLYLQNDNSDGMEFSIGGSGFRPSINSYMYGDAAALANIARLTGDETAAKRFTCEAADIKDAVQRHLWNPGAHFFETSVIREGQLVSVNIREQIGFIPWYFNLPDPGKGYETAWTQLLDPEGFAAPYGPATAERRHPRFMESHRHDCLWNGPSWPFATTQTLVAMANLINNYPQSIVSSADYAEQLRIYARSQYKEGKPWIAEDLDPLTGTWIVDKPRSLYYNHSGFCDLVITGLAGLRPRADDTVEINPLIPTAWDYFCLENIPYHGRNLTILFDRTGERYHKGRGLILMENGREIAKSSTLGRLSAKLLPPEADSPLAVQKKLPAIGGLSRRQQPISKR